MEWEWGGEGCVGSRGGIASVVCVCVCVCVRGVGREQDVSVGPDSRPHSRSPSVATSTSSERMESQKVRYSYWNGVWRGRGGGSWGKYCVHRKDGGQGGVSVSRRVSLDILKDPMTYQKIMQG